MWCFLRPSCLEQNVTFCATIPCHRSRVRCVCLCVCVWVGVHVLVGEGKFRVSVSVSCSPQTLTSYKAPNEESFLHLISTSAYIIGGLF